MAAELEQHLERAEKALSKNKLEQAIREYEAAHKLAPTDAEIIRTLGDLYTRTNKPDSASHYHGLLFDRYFEQNDAVKAVAVYRRNLEATPQPPERVWRLAALLHRQSKAEEAVATYQQAAELAEKANQEPLALQCREKIATLQPDNPEAQVCLAELAKKLEKLEVAGKAYLRAAQLVRPDDLDRAIALFEEAYAAIPNDRSILLNFAQALLAKDNPSRAVELLMPLYAESVQDPAVLMTLGEALLAEKRLKEAEEVLGLFYQLQPDSFDKLFDLADFYCKANQAEEAVTLLGKIKDRLSKAHRQKDFVARLDTTYHLNETLVPLAEFAAAAFNEANQEGRYYEVLGNLFTRYVEKQDFNRAADALDRLTDVDPYDFQNQKRLEQLQDKIDPARLRGLSARLGSVATVPEQAAVSARPEELKKEEELPVGDVRKMHGMLEDLIVQVEIFLQYSLQAKAIEKLQRIAQLFPGEEQSNPRLYRLYEQAQFFPQGFQPREAAPAAAAPAPAVAAAPPVETVSDLAKITEITHALYRQGNPKNVLYTAVSEVGKYLHASRCLGALGRPGAAPAVAVEYCALGTPQSSGAIVLKLLALLAQHEFPPSGTIVLDDNLTPELKQLGAKSILAAPLVDKEKQEQAGLLILQQAEAARQWKPNEIYLLQAIADQAMIAVNHTRLRTLMKTMGVADESTGLLSRGNYLDCLLSEVTRAKSQGTALTVTLLEIDKGGQLLRELGEATIQEFMQKAGECVVSNLRQSDLAVKYTATALALVLPDTTAEKAKGVAEKVRKLLATLKPPASKISITFSGGISEAKVRPDFDVVDTVTDVINRAEFSLEEARKRGNALAVA